MTLLEVTNDPDLVEPTTIKDVRKGYRRYEALLKASNILIQKKTQDKFRVACGMVKQEHIDLIFFGKKNVHNYKAPFKQFIGHVATNAHPDFRRMQLWLQDAPGAPESAEIWGAFYKGGRDLGLTDFASWQADLAGKIAPKDPKRSHKKKQRE